ncbi:1-aminocyclopropane-1-carboxylate oxidase 5 [Sesamum angolense]|uniref:1-aminocyclopropane-1-carboxylate oxidase 5 n=1 Tax=Sesamum angolense TaxID=2727404 RepID=A0AAE1WCX1_9LAMI|nr:1-aminocyclopropane-1-carboxylate oxidase 5 [Sesamum angolense]
MAIPVIDFSKIEGDERAETLAQIDSCCEEWGFFQLLERVKKVASECYKLEREPGFKNSKPVQLLNELIEKKSDGKVETVDWEDVFLLSDENENDWPSETPSFKETMKEYRVELRKLAIKVMEVMDENLGLSKATSTRSSMVEEGECCLFRHQDDEVKGLQILKDGEWIDVQPLKNAIVINIGDQIEVLSNGRYKSVWHRVFATPDGNRRSIASFYNPSYKAMIEPATKSLVQKVEKEEENPAKYPKFVFGDYMSVYVEQKFLPKEPRFQAVKAI